MNSEKSVTQVNKAEEDSISRSVLAWLNTYQGIPDTVSFVNLDQLPADTAGMALSTIPGTYITNRYIYGGHVAEYQFKVIYRIKPGMSNDKRLLADELLNNVGSWATNNKPDLGDGIRVIKVEQTTIASLFDTYENGDEDRQILLKLTYEVI